MRLIKDLGMIYITPTSKQKRRYGIYECTECFTHFTSNTANVKKNSQKVCKPCAVGNVKRTHGESDTRLYTVWQHMKDRCINPLSAASEWYGDKGVTVCDDWLLKYENFRDWAINNGYKDNLTIDRKNSQGNYEPNNCRWITGEENTRLSSVRDNYGNNKLIKVSIDEASEICEAYATGLFSKQTIANALDINAHVVRYILKKEWMEYDMKDKK